MKLLQVIGVLLVIVAQTSTLPLTSTTPDEVSLTDSEKQVKSFFGGLFQLLDWLAGGMHGEDDFDFEDYFNSLGSLDGKGSSGNLPGLGTLDIPEDKEGDDEELPGAPAAPVIPSPGASAGKGDDVDVEEDEGDDEEIIGGDEDIGIEEEDAGDEEEDDGKLPDTLPPKSTQISPGSLPPKSVGGSSSTGSLPPKSVGGSSSSGSLPPKSVGGSTSTLPTKEAPSTLPTKDAPSTLPTKEAPSTLPTKEVPSTLPTKEAPSTLPTKDTTESLPAKSLPDEVLDTEDVLDTLPSKSLPSDDSLI